jgi:aromatic ring-opening dioxygenase catalytic subunit (LigB family)
MTSHTTERKPLPTLYIPHGGGPCFFMDWTMGPADTWHKMEAWLRQLGASIYSDHDQNQQHKPDAIVVFSAHWENDVVTINSSAQPPLYFDYYNFPPHTYELTYPAPGHPELASTIENLLSVASIPCRQDAKHGFDHGVFIPFLLIYPEADIPIVQVSLTTSLDPAEHIALGRALAPLREQNILLVGSGLSYHNMSALMDGPGSSASTESLAFDRWLSAVCEAAPQERNKSLAEWKSAPSAQQAHPREEHLIPLMVMAGAGGEDSGKTIFKDQVLGATVSAFQFG